MGHLRQALSTASDTLGFDHATGGDGVFRHLVLARLIEPTSKLGRHRPGVLPHPHPSSSPVTLTRRLPMYCGQGFRESLAAARAREQRSVATPAKPRVGFAQLW